MKWKLISIVGSLGAFFLLTGATAMSSGCLMCDEVLRTAISVRVLNADGQTVVPDGVYTIKDDRKQACEPWDDSYSCYERGAGLYVLRVERGSESWEWQLFLGADGCHTESRDFDAVLTSP